MSKELELDLTNRSTMGEGSLPREKQNLWLGSSFRGAGLGQDGSNPSPKTGEENLGLSPFAAPVGCVPHLG